MSKPSVPNIRENFPLAGERIGPAWRMVWRELSDVHWRLGAPLAERVAKRHGLKAHTVANLLREARQRGVLEVRYHREGEARGCAKPPAWYRIPRPGRIRDNEPGITGKLESFSRARKAVRARKVATVSTSTRQG